MRGQITISMLLRNFRLFSLKASLISLFKRLRRHELPCLQLTTMPMRLAGLLAPGALCNCHITISRVTVLLPSSNARLKSVSRVMRKFLGNPNFFMSSQGSSCQRPFRRLRLKVMRPPGVLMRARNPIFFLRFRTFGLYVGSIRWKQYSKLMASNGNGTILMYSHNRSPCQKRGFWQGQESEYHDFLRSRHRPRAKDFPRG